MDMPRLNIDIQNAEYELKITKPKMKISGQKANYKIDKKAHKFTISNKAAKLTIDNYPAFSQLDSMKKPMDMLKKYASLGKQAGMAATSKFVREGDRMAAIENGGNAIVEIEAGKMYQGANKSINIEHFPKNRIKISVEKGYSKGNYTPGNIKTIASSNLKIEAEMGDVTGKVTKRAKVNIDVVG